MRSTPLAEARAEFSKLVDLALNGEPQRVTRRGREAVVIVSEAEWASSQGGAHGGAGSTPATTAVPEPRTFVELLVALGSIEGIDEIVNPKERFWKSVRPLGADFFDDPADE